MTEQERFIIARWAYAIGKEFIGDVEYDTLEKKFKETGVLREYTSRGWSEDPCPYDLLKKYNLDEFIVSVQYTYKTESIESINTEEAVENKFITLNEESRLSMKLDGFNIRLNYFNGHFVSANTRNRNDGVAKELYHLNSLFPKTIPIKGKVLVVGELCLKKDTFEEYKKLRGVISIRNGVSTAIANSDIAYLTCKFYNIYTEEKVDITDKYKLLSYCGFATPYNIKVNNYKSLLKGIEIMGKQYSRYNTPVDGLVLENSSMQYAIRIGAWKEEENFSYITGYTINRGIYNNNFLVKIRPVFVNQKTVSEIDVDNIQNIIDNNLRIGYPIVFEERSSVNSVINATKTKILQDRWISDLDKFKSLVEEKYSC